MRAYVFSDGALVKHAGRFAWLSVNTEKAENAGFLEKFPVQSWPTLFVIDPLNETVLLKWAGSATVPELSRLFDDVERSRRPAERPAAEDALATADRLNGEGRVSEAVAAYAQALAAGGVAWTRRARAVESLTSAAESAGDFELCAQTAVKEAATLERGPEFANAVASGLGCTFRAPPDAAWGSDARRKLEPLLEQALTLDGVLADDRSSFYDILITARQRGGDTAGATALTREWLAFLDAEAKRAPSPEARAALDGHRVTAALKLRDPERALPALEASERDLPGDYNPPERLAILYSELGRFGDALGASDRSLAKIYGPRRLRALDTRASIYSRKGDLDAARHTLEEALKYAETLPPAQRPRRMMEKFKTELEKTARASTEADIQHLLADQVSAWNRRDLLGFMGGYWKSPDLSFYSGSSPTRGWQATLDRYKKRYLSSRREMGKLAFQDLTVEVLSSTAAITRGAYQLTLASGRVQKGLFTLMLRKFADGWKIIHDHTSTD